MSRWSIQWFEAMPLCIEHGILFINTVDTKIKACNALNAMFVETVDTTLKTHPHIPAHNFLNIQWIFNPQKSFGKLTLRAFQPYHQYYTCWYCWHKTRIFNAFNAIYVDTVDTKHIHTFLSITFLIFNGFSIRKKFWKADTQGFSTIPSILYMSTLSTQDKYLQCIQCYLCRHRQYSFHTS